MFTASGRKYNVINPRPTNVLTKSKTLPRSMGSKTSPGSQNPQPPTKHAHTPPAIKRQLSVGITDTILLRDMVNY